MSKVFILICITAIMQGCAIVLFPAASIIFTDPELFNLSSEAYGALFIPQVIVAILGSLLSAKINFSGRVKSVYLCGLAANFASMLLLAGSVVLINHHIAAYGILLSALAFAGLGYGLTAPCLNIYAGLYFPHKLDNATLIVNALVGLGTALAPLSLLLFIALKLWWGLPLLLTGCFISLFLFTILFKFKEVERQPLGSEARLRSIPKEFWVFAGFSILYGIVETVSGNWTIVFMKEHMDKSITAGSFALAAFWAMITMGRVFFGTIGNALAHRAYFLFPLMTAAALLGISMLPPNQIVLGVVLSGICGLGCSILFPLSVSFASRACPAVKNSVPGGIIMCYLLGYAVSAFGAGALHDEAGTSLDTIFVLGSCCAIILGAIGYKIIKEQFN